MHLIHLMRGQGIHCVQKSKSFRRGQRPRGDGIFSVASGNWLSHIDFDGERFWTLHEEPRLSWAPGERSGTLYCAVLCWAVLCWAGLCCAGLCCAALRCAVRGEFSEAAVGVLGARSARGDHYGAPLAVADKEALPSDSRYREDLANLKKGRKDDSQR